MNSGELKVDVPLASIESDCEDPGDGNSAMNTPSKRDNKLTANKPKPKLSSLNIEGGDSVTGSLEDLVNTFDEKLTVCFGDFKEQVDKIAPVQVRSQEEIMNECQVWWTLTGNFGNMMPIDWTKTYTRANYLPTLNLCAPRHPPAPAPAPELAEEDDIVAADLDMHQLILQSEDNSNEPIKSAEEVLQEIDDIIDEDEEEEEG